MSKTIRVGLIGAGANTRSRHIPGFRAIPGVEIVAVCNRRPESSGAVAKEFSIPRTFANWEELVSDPDIDAVAVGTWPYLHAPITIAALNAGKHLLTEARMAMNAAEAHRMWAAARANPKLVAQIVPSPFGLRADTVVKELITSGYLGDLREVSVVSLNNSLGGPEVPLHWRQDRALSGFNMLTVGIVHETLMRWTALPVAVMAQAHAFVATRLDPASGTRRPVGTPDNVQILAMLADGSRAVYQFSGVAPVGSAMSITLRGSAGMLHYDLLADRLFGMQSSSGTQHPEEITVPPEKAGGWRVEQEFIDCIQSGAPVRFTDFKTGVAYMEFTEAVARSARDGVAVRVPAVEE